MNRLLLIEDNARIRLTNKEFLEREGYVVHTASTLAAGKRILDSNEIDLIVLDIMLPDGTGIDFCAKIREETNVPLLYLTCLAEDNYLVEALKAGGDDYMTKPYRLKALSARIMALLRRTRMGQPAGELKVGLLTADSVKRAAYYDGEDLHLKPKEFDLLMLFLREPDKRFTAQQIYSRIWHGETHETRTVVVHISSLRKKLGKTPFKIITESRKYYSLITGASA